MCESVVRMDLGGQQVVKINGWVDYTNSEDFREELARAMENGGSVVVDLSDAEAMDSSALSGLVSAQRRARDSDVEFVLHSVSHKVQRMMQAIGLATAFGMPGPKPYFAAEPGFRSKSELRRQDWRITESVVLADLELLDNLRNLAASACREAGMDEGSVADVRLAVTEALVNAYHHGSPRHGQSKIRLRCTACSCAFVAEVLDEGEGVAPELIQELLSPRNERGLGIKLIHAAMDEVEYLHAESGGHVRMLKWIG